ncbi:hypothetical protein OQA88_391 [Cercophora sp. LCS_1]
MAELDANDPFHWDVDRVVRELCSQTKSWTGPNKLPDPHSLEAALRDTEMDGEALLTYGEEFGIPALWEALSIRKAPHQLSMNAALKWFRKNSPAYRKWKQQREAENHSDGGIGLGSTNIPCDGHVDGIHEPQIPPQLTQNGGTSTRHTAPIAQAKPVTQPTQSIPADNSHSLKRSANDISTSESPVRSPSGPPFKKRRALLMNISSIPVHAGGLFAPTEADFLQESPTPPTFQERLRAQDGTVEAVLAACEASELPSGYLGKARLASEQILRAPEMDDRSDDEDDISWVRTRPLPPGRCQQISSAMKRLHRAGLVLDESESEDVLPGLRESDGEDAYDEDTLREIEEEEQERKAAMIEASQAHLIDKEAEERGARFAEVADVVGDVIQQLEEQWMATKKLEKDRKARAIWDTARRDPNRQEQIKEAIARRRELENRMVRFFNRILETTPLSPSELETRALDWFEPTFADVLKETWLVDLLRSQSRPPHPRTLPKPPSRPKKELRKPREEGVSISSGSEADSESDMDDFIVDDGPTFAPMDVDLDPNSGPDSNNHPRNGSPDKSIASNPEVADNPLHSPPPPRTPAKPEPLMPTTPLRVKQLAKHQPIEILDSPPPPLETTDLPGFDEIGKIKEIGTAHWVNAEDADRLVICIIASWPQNRRATFFEAVQRNTAADAWNKFVQPLLDEFAGEGPKEPVEVDSNSLTFSFARLFDCYFSRSAGRINRTSFRQLTSQRFCREEAKFSDFYGLLCQIMPHFGFSTLQTPKKKIKIVVKRNTPTRDAAEERDGSESSASENSAPEDAAAGSPSEMSQPVSTKKANRAGRPKNKAAAQLRSTNVEQQRQFDERRRELRELLAVSGAISSDKARLIVNETKRADEELIYVNDEIGSKIKDHQIDGVRFMWNHVVVESSVRQGCLLAHEMGLGKTMQVITLLVVIAEAAASKDPAVYNQIPEQLRESKTLVLCPSGLVNNWVDEFLLWAPEGLLGPMFKIDATVPTANREDMVAEWANNGGILIIGYALFTDLINQDNETSEALHTRPHIVIADEAHTLKNPTTQRHRAAQGFTTMSRIALTGSPLTKNVMDYYSMINWVAPNYLADIAEFIAQFGKPISEGLYADSDSAAKRRSRKLLQVLKDIVSPKVHRRDVRVLEATLPGKKEFIITLCLTDAQMATYGEYLEALKSPGIGTGTGGMATAWSLVSVLSLLLAHPVIMRNIIQSKSKMKKKRKGTQQNETDHDKGLDLIPPDLLKGALATLNSLKDIDNLMYSNKLRVLLHILDECRKVGDKVLVFSQNIPVLDYIGDVLKRQKRNFKRLDGNTAVHERQANIKDFNDDPNSEVYLISTRAGGVGLNIYGANRVVLFDFKYTPAEEQQAIGRAYRIGQQKQVYVYWLTVGGTFEDAIHNNAIFKTQLASRVVDKKNPNPSARKRGGGEYFVAPTIPELDEESLEAARGKDDVLDVLLGREDFEGVIRKVTPTETFEKEEEYELSPEDKREVAEDVRMERLRQSNPAEYRRLEKERAARLGPGFPGFQVPAAGLNLPDLPDLRLLNGIAPAAAINVAMLPAPEVTRDERPEGLVTAQYSAPPAPVVDLLPLNAPEVAKTDQLTIQTQLVSRSAAQGEEEIGQAQRPAVQHQPQAANPPEPDALMDRSIRSGSLPPKEPLPPPPIPRRLPYSDSAYRRRIGPGGAFPSLFSETGGTAWTPRNNGGVENFEPVLAAGTHYKAGDAASPSQNSLDKSEEQLVSSLSDVFKQMQTTGQIPQFTPKEVMANINAQLDAEGSHGLPRMDKLAQIKNLVRNSELTAQALLSGQLEPRAFCGKERSEMSNIVKSVEEALASTTKTSYNPPQERDRSKQGQTERSSGVMRAKDLRELQRIEQHKKRGKRGNLAPSRNNSTSSVRPGDTPESPCIID